MTLAVGCLVPCAMALGISVQQHPASATRHSASAALESDGTALLAALQPNGNLTIAIESGDASAQLLRAEPAADKQKTIGHMILCLNATHNDRSRLRWLLVHGLLLLLGYRHGEGALPADASLATCGADAREMAVAEQMALRRLGWAGDGLVASALSVEQQDRSSHEGRRWRHAASRRFLNLCGSSAQPRRVAASNAQNSDAQARELPTRRPEQALAVGLLYATTTGNTETVAGYLAAALGVEPLDVADCDAKTLAGFDALIVGAPTWHTGAETRRSGTDWDDFLYTELPSAEEHLSGMKVACFGVGDQLGYAHNFCDALAELAACFEATGATLVGATSVNGYEHAKSKAVRVEDGRFVGLVCDEDNQPELSDVRVRGWVAQLEAEGMFTWSEAAAL